MTTTTRAPATRAPEPTLTLDERLALASLAMDDRLATAKLAVDVNSAHIATDPLPEITIPHLPQPAVPCPYRTPVAAILWRARNLLEERGWCQGARSNEAGAICPEGAIQYAAPGSDLVWPALGLLLEVIRREFREDDAQSVPHWNDQHGTSFMAFRFLDQAAELANSRNQ
ncbi:hypothetical protein ABZX95_17240 [Streptomyces sp. NPDC004232]|uniref:DUF6197 family protein n=1 Tax=Streptomyces sp. NPDC004232 TaxID=3154454 RepID=UPI00339FC4CF